MDPPGIVIVTGVTATSNTATFSVESRNATSMLAGCQKTFGGVCEAAANVTMYPPGRCVVDVTNLEPRTRYELSVSAVNETSSTPSTNVPFSTRSVPKA